MIFVPGMVLRDQPDWNNLEVGRCELPPPPPPRKPRRSSKRENPILTPPRERPIIVWDGEGINLSGRRAQHYVLFGCSADVDNPLVIKDSTKWLKFHVLADYMIKIAQRYPDAFHMGYFFNYDQNMIIRSLPASKKEKLYQEGLVRYDMHFGYRYWIKLTPKKTIQITRIDRANDERHTIKIDDYAHFYGTSFVKAYRDAFPDCDNDPSFKIIMEGKAMRDETTWEDMPAVRRYWSHEIVAMQRLAEQLRTILYDAGFEIKNWHGPGALASYVRREYWLAHHEFGVKAENMPPEVHLASKHAFFGGRFEPFKLGRIQGPVYVYDRNSAYPYAFCQLPTFKEGGYWKHTIGEPDDIEDFGMYRVTWHRPHGIEPRDDGKEWPSEIKLWYHGFSQYAEPLPYRGYRGEICYPDYHAGWYWTPEIESILSTKGGEHLTIHEAWVWHPLTIEHPWREVIEPMYAERLRLKARGDVTQMAYKLAMNSLYGKTAQRVGWDKKKMKGPSTHALPIAGYITSHCRAAIWQVISWGWGANVAVETDGVISMKSPETFPLPIGKGLGEWSVTEYDEMLFLQSGFYAARKGDKWTIKTRGIPASAFNDGDGQFDPTIFSDFLASCRADNEWPNFPLPPSSRFVGLGAAFARSRLESGGINPCKFNEIHCRWERDEPILRVGYGGKRRHFNSACQACQAGLSGNDVSHNTQVVGQRTPGCDPLDIPFSYPHRIPWDIQEEDADDSLIRLAEEMTYDWTRE
jgi:hypothetical protein